MQTEIRRDRIGHGREDARGRARFVQLSDSEWPLLEQVVRQVIALEDSRRPDTRRFVDAALSVMVGQCAWTQLPEDQFGDWRVCYNRNERWIERGVWTVLANSGVMLDAWSARVVAYAERRVREKRFRAKRQRRGD
ncbi:Putative transposase of IS4/5 family [Lysobacter sp. yr284]|uniref:transposase n=1 Tax=Lysobacter TaxID=68 RepID=UPI00089B6617|nr:transposase [Lysobacter sp. yr284]SDZ08217.1 Putative transposase of IS4/5 family [Lysobacter sp. yr284]